MAQHLVGQSFILKHYFHMDVTMYSGNNSKIRSFLKAQQLLATYTPMLQKVGWKIHPLHLLVAFIGMENMARVANIVLSSLKYCRNLYKVDIK